MMQCVPAMLVWIKNSYHDYYNWIMGLHEMMHSYSVLCRNLIVFWCILMHYSVCLQTLDDQVAPMWIFNFEKTFLYGSWMKMQLLSILDYFVTWLCTVRHGNCMVIYGCYGWTVDGDVDVPYVDSGLLSGCFGCVYWIVMSMICVIY